MHRGINVAQIGSVFLDSLKPKVDNRIIEIDVINNHHNVKRVSLFHFFRNGSHKNFGNSPKVIIHNREDYQRLIKITSDIPSIVEEITITCDNKEQLLRSIVCEKYNLAAYTGNGNPTKQILKPLKKKRTAGLNEKVNSRCFGKNLGFILDGSLELSTWLLPNTRIKLCITVDNLPSSFCEF